MKKPPSNKNKTNKSDRYVPFLDAIALECQMIQRGVRSAADFTVRADDMPAIMETIEQNVFSGRIPLYVYRETLTKNHVNITIYRHRHIEEVLKAVRGLQHDRDTVVKWTNGRLFGYSEQSIADFIELNNPTIKVTA